jgi:hypothetical protein
MLLTIVSIVIHLSSKKCSEVEYLVSKNFQNFSDKTMAYVAASQLSNRQRVWVYHKPYSSRHQLNSHREGVMGNSLRDAGIDGLETADLAGLHTNYEGHIFLGPDIN